MTKDPIDILACYQDCLNNECADISKITSAPDFRLVTEAPVRVDPQLESEHLRIHQDSASKAGIENWGFLDTINALSSIEGDEVEFIAFKGAGYAAKMYLMPNRSLPLGLVITKRAEPAPPVDESGRVPPSEK